MAKSAGGVDWCGWSIGYENEGEYGLAGKREQWKIVIVGIG